MSAWNELTPTGAEAANTLATLIQNAKADILERLRVTNHSSIDEHDVYGTSPTGRHPLSKVDFTCIYGTNAAYIAGRSNPFAQEGTLHYIIATNKLYVGRISKVGSTDPLDYISLLATTDHGEYYNLDKDDHTQYLLKDGSRVMTGNLTLGSTAARLLVDKIEKADDQPIAEIHASQDWYTAHGADAITGAHFADGTVSTLNFYNGPVGPETGQTTFFPLPHTLSKFPDRFIILWFSPTKADDKYLLWANDTPTGDIDTSGTYDKVDLLSFSEFK